MAISITEVSRVNFPVSLASGAAKQRCWVFIRATVDANGEGQAITAYTSCTGIDDIEGVVYATDATAGKATAETNITWSSASANFAYASDYEVCLVCTYK